MPSWWSSSYNGYSQETFLDYWLRALTKSLLRRCVPCTRFRATKPVQQMGDLPPQRVNPSYPFENVGLDFAGPLLYKLSRNNVSKAYVAVFICMATKCVHLELVSDLSSQTCLAELRRFVARSGLLKCVYSENGTNFVGARNELYELYKALQHKNCKEQLGNFFATRKVT